jgi:glutamate synthase domain-containing protein 3
MSHGIAYVLDEEAELPQKVNKELVYLERVTAEEDQTFLKGLIQRHSELTGSQKAAHILARWASSIPLFWKVVPYPPTGVAGARGVVALVGRAAGRDLRGTAARPAPQAASKGATPSSPAGAQP